MKSRTINNTIKKYGMLENCKTVIAAVSGGSDSMCMLFLMEKLCREHNINLVCAHFNHQLRGEDSDADEKYVSDYCEKNGIEFVCGSANVKEYANNNSISIELAAREKRYSFLFALASKYESAKIATAHTKNDNAETVIFNICRGASIKGLCGIPPVRDNIIRPIIELSREDTENCCRENGIDFVTDKTNFETDYSRNNIRLNIIPRLTDINSSAVDNIFRMSELLRYDSTFIDDKALECYKIVKSSNSLSIPLLNSQEDAILSRIVLLFLKDNYNGEYDNKLISDAVSLIKNGHTGSKTQISGDLFFIVNYDKFEISRVTDTPNELFSIDIPDEGVYSFNGKEYEIKYSDKMANKLYSIDAEKLAFPFILNTAKQGDLYYIPNVGRKPVNRLFTDRKIPKSDRPFLPVLRKESEIVWIEKIGASQNYKTDKKTKKYIIITPKEK